MGEKTAMDTLPNELLFGQHVLWSYGSGQAGVGDGQLCGPHSAEENPLNPDEIAVAEQYGCVSLVLRAHLG